MPAVPARALSATFLLVAVSIAMVPVRAKLAAVSCSGTVLSFVAASARLLRADSSRSMSGEKGAGVTPCALPPVAHPPPRSQNLTLALEMREVERSFPGCPGAGSSWESFPIIHLTGKMLGSKDSC